MASLTVTTILSPILAYSCPLLPKTRIHRTSLAPLLSATFNLLSCWIIIFSFELAVHYCRQLNHVYYLRPPGPVALFCFLNYLNKPPTFGLAERTGFHYSYHIT